MNRTSFKLPDTSRVNWLSTFFVSCLLIFSIGSTMELVKITSNMTGLPLLARQLVTVIFTDLGILFWDKNRRHWTEPRQITIAAVMQFESIAITTVFAGLYMFIAAMGDFIRGATYVIVLLDVPIELTVYGWVELLVVATTVWQFSSALFAYYLAAQASPEETFNRERVRAERQHMEAELNAYNVAIATTSATVGESRAIKRLADSFEDMGFRGQQIDALLDSARGEMAINRRRKPGVQPALEQSNFSPVDQPAIRPETIVNPDVVNRAIGPTITITPVPQMPLVPAEQAQRQLIDERGVSESPFLSVPMNGNHHKETGG